MYQTENRFFLFYKSSRKINFSKTFCFFPARDTHKKTLISNNMLWFINTLFIKISFSLFLPNDPYFVWFITTVYYNRKTNFYWKYSSALLFFLLFNLLIISLEMSIFFFHSIIILSNLRANKTFQTVFLSVAIIITYNCLS